MAKALDRAGQLGWRVRDGTNISYSNPASRHSARGASAPSGTGRDVDPAALYDDRASWHVPPTDLIEASLDAVAAVGATMTEPVPTAVRGVTAILRRGAMMPQATREFLETEAGPGGGAVRAGTAVAAAPTVEQLCYDAEVAESTIEAARQSVLSAISDAKARALAAATEQQTAEDDLRAATVDMQTATDELKELGEAGRRHFQEAAALPQKEVAARQTLVERRVEIATLNERIKPVEAAIQEIAKEFEANHDEDALLSKRYSELAEERATLQAAREKLVAYEQLHAGLLTRYRRDWQRKTKLNNDLKEASLARRKWRIRIRRYRRVSTPRPRWDVVTAMLPELEGNDSEWRVADSVAAIQHDRELASGEQGRWPLPRVPGGDMGGRSRHMAAALVTVLSRAQVNEFILRDLERTEHEIEAQKAVRNRLKQEVDYLWQQSPDAGKAARKRSAAKRDEGSSDKFFIALGTGAGVPRFLRHNGKVRDKSITKGELESLIHQVWRDKKARELKLNQKFTLADFLYRWLQARFGLQAVVAEWGYSILHALSKYVWDADVELFMLILAGAVNEFVYYDQNAMVDALKKTMAGLCEAYQRKRYVEFTEEVAEANDAMPDGFNGRDAVGAGAGGAGSVGSRRGSGVSVSERHLASFGPGTGRVRHVDLIATLREFFPRKTDRAMQEILEALVSDKLTIQPGGLVDWAALWEETADGDQTDFVEAVRDQHLQEAQDFMVRLGALLMEKDTVNTGLVRLRDIKTTLMRLDSMMSREQLNVYLARGLGKKKDPQKINFDLDAMTNYEAFLRRLNEGPFKRTLNWNGMAQPVIAWATVDLELKPDKKKPVDVTGKPKVHAGAPRAARVAAEKAAKAKAAAEAARVAKEEAAAAARVKAAAEKEAKAKEARVKQLGRGMSFHERRAVRRANRRGGGDEDTGVSPASVLKHIGGGGSSASLLRQPSLTGSVMTGVTTPATATPHTLPGGTPKKKRSVRFFQ